MCDVRRKELIRIIREEFDPTPSWWEGREWYDNAEDIATKIIELFTDAKPDTDGRRE